MPRIYRQVSCRADGDKKKTLICNDVALVIGAAVNVGTHMLRYVLKILILILLDPEVELLYRVVVLVTIF